LDTNGAWARILSSTWRGVIFSRFAMDHIQKIYTRMYMVQTEIRDVGERIIKIKIYKKDNWPEPGIEPGTSRSQCFG
jgi:hypothetical protein